MARNSKIEWTDHTFNPWRGCTKVSDGCKNCYAANMGRRFGVDWGPGADRVPATEAMWQQPYRWGKPLKKNGLLQRTRRVFCASMADVFDDHPSILPVWRERLWDAITNTFNLDWFILTKRPENINKYIPDFLENWSGFWVGASVENQDAADRRIPHLMKARWDQMFLSIEPMIGPINIKEYLDERYCDYHGDRGPRCNCSCSKPRIGWVICGGETGPGARPMNLDWARSLRDQCADAGVPFFFKSTGGRKKSPLLDGRTWKEFPA